MKKKYFGGKIGDIGAFLLSSCNFPRVHAGLNILKFNFCSSFGCLAARKNGDEQKGGVSPQVWK